MRAMKKALLLLLASVSIPVAGAAYVFRAQITSLPFSPPAENAAPSSPASAPQDFRKVMAILVNQERTKLGLPALRKNALLDKAAQAHAEDMLAKKYFSHTSQDGRKPQDRIFATGYKAPVCNCVTKTAYGENIARDRKTAADAMKMWMGSAVHRGNILSTNFQEIGTGSAGGIWVQTFGKITVEQK